MSALAKRRSLGVTGAMLLVMSLVMVVGLPALAHVPSISVDCNGLEVELKSYNTGGNNEVTVTVDGVVVDDDSNFGSSYSYTHTWDNTKDHTYVVVVKAHDDSDGSRGWSKTWQGSQKACNPSSTTTATTVPGSTTTATTVPGSTTTATTVPGSTTTATTVPGSTTTATTVPGSTTTATTLPNDQSATEIDTETEVLGIQVSLPENLQVNPVTQETLPFTGVSTGSMALLAAAFAGAGLLLLLAARQTEEKNPARSWN